MRNVFEWISGNLGTLVVSLLLAGIVAAIVVRLVRKGHSCCGDCARCARAGRH